MYFGVLVYCYGVYGVDECFFYVFYVGVGVIIGFRLGFFWFNFFFLFILLNEGMVYINYLDFF